MEVCKNKFQFSIQQPIFSTHLITIIAICRWLSRSAKVAANFKINGFDGIYAKLIRNIRSPSDLSPKNERYVRHLHLVNKCGRWEFDATFPIKLFYILRWGSFYLVFIALASETKKRRTNGRMNESTLNLAFKSHHEKKTHRRPSSSWLT